MSAHVEVRGLRIRAGARQLVRGVDFSAEKGMVTGLIGESGSGKSLTSQALLGLVPEGLTAEGAVTLGGRTLRMGFRNGRRRWARGAAMILQNPMSCFDPVFTVGAHFKETLDAHDAARGRNRPDRWKKALSEAGFPEPGTVLGLYPFQMSGGMLQRVMIALALVTEATFIVADEATTDLDTVSQARVLDLLDGLVRGRGIGVLLVTHDLSVVARLADRVLVMQDGRLVEQGDAVDIFRTPGHPYTASLLAAHYRLHGSGGGTVGAGYALVEDGP